MDKQVVEQVLRSTMERTHTASSPQKNGTSIPSSDSCERCDGIGFYKVDVPYEHELWGKMIACPACTDQSWVAQRLAERSGLSAAMRLATFEASRSLPLQTKALDAVRSVLDRGYGMVALTGPVGVGKSYVLACACNEAMKQEHSVYYNVTARLFDQLRGTYDAGDGEIGFHTLWDMIEQVHLLALDEFSVFNPSPWANEKFRTLLSVRHDHRLECITLLAGNMGVESWPAWLSSRLKGADAAIVEMGGKDLRQAIGRSR